MNKTLFILFIHISIYGLGQNLIPNPSFEEYDECPTTISSVGDYQINHCTEWTAPSLATSDYFNACSPIANVPNAVFSYQFAYDGVGMLGMLMEIDSGEIPYFEYVQTKLTKPLIQGYRYKFSFNVNLANSSDYAVEKIGAWFTSNPVSSNDGLPLFSDIPQVENTNGFITDTIGWTSIDGDFIANGDEKYLTIGYYTDTLNIDTLRNNPSAIPSVIFVYYYIDGVVLEKVEQKVIIPNIITPNGDNINDLFRLNFKYENVIIYNRWGQQIFKSINNEPYWDGRTASGKKAPVGTYYYIITSKDCTYKGFVQVIR